MSPQEEETRKHERRMEVSKGDIVRVWDAIDGLHDKMYKVSVSAGKTETHLENILKKLEEPKICKQENRITVVETEVKNIKGTWKWFVGALTTLAIGVIIMLLKGE